MRSDDTKDTSGESTDRPIRGVLFDFHGTVAQVEPLQHSVEWAARVCGVKLGEYGSTVLADALGALGWVGSGQAAKVLPSFAAAWADRDLSEHSHREAFIGLASGTSGAFDGFAEAMYERLCDPQCWVAYPDALSTLRQLRSAGVPTALVSNIGFDLRPVLKHLEMDDLFDELVLSYEIGWAKPEPAIFMDACIKLGVQPEDALMVGDSLADAAAIDVGLRALLVPHTPAGHHVGVSAVAPMIGLPS